MLPQVSNPTCRLDRTHPNANIDLAWRGGTFAGLSPVEAIAFKATTSDATAVVETSDLLVVGEVDLHRVLVAPRERDVLVDGYLEVRRARVAQVIGDRAVLTPLAPTGVRPAVAPTLEVSCASLAVGSIEAGPAVGKPVSLRPGSPVELATTPGGKPVATIQTPEAPPIPRDGDTAEASAVLPEVRLLERNGAFARIAVRERWTGAVGWIAASALSKAPPTATDAASTPLPAPAAPLRPARRCTLVVTLFLRHGDDVVIAGRFRPQAPIRTLGHDRQGEMRVALPFLFSSLGDERRGDEPEPPVPFVRDAAVKGCRLDP